MILNNIINPDTHLQRAHINKWPLKPVHHAHLRTYACMEAYKITDQLSGKSLRQTYDDTMGLTGEWRGTARREEAPQRRKRGCKWGKMKDAEEKIACILRAAPDSQLLPGTLTLLLSTFNHNVHQESTDYRGLGGKHRERESGRGRDKNRPKGMSQIEGNTE